MGGLRKYMPITWITSLIGSLALIGTPFLSGFYSKDSIILAAENSHIAGAGYATFAVLAGVFVTAFYSFRMYFLVFHGPERFRNKPFPGEHDAHAAAHDEHGHDAHGHGAHGDAAHAKDAHGHDAHGHDHVHVPHESPAVVWIPLVALAIPSLLIGYFTVAPMLAGDFFGSSIFIDLHKHPAMEHVAEHAAHAMEMGLHAFTTAPFWLALAGVVAAWFLYLQQPSLAEKLGRGLSAIRTVLLNKYYFDWFNENVIARGARLLGKGLWKGGDQVLIDGALVNGSAATVGFLAGVVRRVQTGYLYSYAFWMVIGLALLVGWFLSRAF
jgi:NADH-quinone oxidoreductase subunit L